MATATLAKKMRITEGATIVIINAPKDYARTLAPLPKDVTITDEAAKRNDFVHLFVESKAELERAFPKVVKALAPDALLWISYPKGGKGIQTDLTRDRGWDILERFTLRWLSLISFDAKWSAFLVQNTPPKEPTSASKNYHATSEAWADAKTKTVRLPEDLAAAFKKNAKAKASYAALSYTNKKEYVLWIVGAKREETRVARVKAAIDKLVAGKRNPGEK